MKNYAEIMGILVAFDLMKHEGRWLVQADETFWSLGFNLSPHLFVSTFITSLFEFSAKLVQPVLAFWTFQDGIWFLEVITETRTTVCMQKRLVYDFLVLHSLHILFILLLGLNWAVYFVVPEALIDQVLLLVVLQPKKIPNLMFACEYRLLLINGFNHAFFYKTFDVKILIILAFLYFWFVL